MVWLSEPCVGKDSEATGFWANMLPLLFSVPIMNIANRSYLCMEKGCTRLAISTKGISAYGRMDARQLSFCIKAVNRT